MGREKKSKRINRGTSKPRKGKPDLDVEGSTGRGRH